MNRRLKALRTHLGMNQKNFAGRLGITDSGLSNLESGKRNLTEQMIISICREFNVNRAWLVEGVGDMFTDLPETVLDELALQFDLCDDEIGFVADFCKLPKQDRDVIIGFLRGKDMHCN
ncbi:helix-turn-helix transcriptional regulator [Lachnospiraceae bacterium 29-84]